MGIELMYFDVETEAHKLVKQWAEYPEVDPGKVPSNWKDKEKIAAREKELEEEAKKKAEAEYQEALDRAALDNDLGRVRAIGVAIGNGEIETRLVPEDIKERDVLRWFWWLFDKSNGYCCGYNILQFDLPYLMKRAFAYQLQIPRRPVLALYRTEPVVDVMKILYNWRGAKSLKWTAKRYGLEVPEGWFDQDGSMVKDMSADEVRTYLAGDVSAVRQLHKMMQPVYL